MASSAAWIAAPAAANPEVQSALSSYARARTAAAQGSSDQASAGFAAALAVSPENQIVAAEALSHAVLAGDWPLALRAATLLERAQALGPDTRFVILADAFRRRDWRSAQRQIEAVEKDQLFAFTAAVLRAWLAVGTRKGDPLAGFPQGLEPGAAYAAEHRPLILAALGREDEVAPAFTGAEASPRTQRLRIAAAATLAAKGERKAGLALLEGDESPVVIARQALSGRRKLPGAVLTPAEGLGELMIRLALDLHVQNMTGTAARFARLATWVAPGNSQTWIVASELLTREDRPAAAIALLAQIDPNDPYAAAARDQRIRLLAENGQSERALAEAVAAAEQPGARVADLVRLGEALSEQDRHGEAALAFAKALDRRGTGDGDFPEWALWLFRGGAHDQAGQWPEARGALERAYTLAPTQPLVLNYLGYAQLTRRENLLEAERLVREAHRLAPDNAAITDSLGWALFLKGNLGEAIPLLEKASEGEPADPEINEHLGDAYFAAGRRIDARFAWRAARVYAEAEAAARLDTKIARGLTPQVAAR